MCLAEALLRIPDDATRDALIRDKIADGDWSGHLGGGKSLFVNAATWGLVVTGKLVGSVDDKGLGAALTRLIARAGEPVIRCGVDLAMRMMGEQFVTGETIEQALGKARTLEARGLDATPVIQARLRRVGTPAAQAAVVILDTILREEVGHVAIGNRWFHWLCARDGQDPLAVYPVLAQRHRAPRLKPPFNLSARRAAGFDEAELQALAAL
jgi:hypothetical protein